MFESSHCAKNFPMPNIPSRPSELAHLPNASQREAVPALARGRLRWALWRRVPDQVLRYAAGVTAALALSTGLLAACGGGSASAPLASSGILRVALTDAPACGYESVFVTVREVRAHKSLTATESDAGWASITLPSPRRIDLLTLTNGALDELGQAPLEAGRYTQMRLLLADNTAATPLANAVRPSGKTEVALETPSAFQSGLKMNVNIDVSANQIADVVIDFDACRSVVTAGRSGRYLLKPVLSVTPRYLSGVRGSLEAVAAGGAAVTLQTAGEVVKATAPDPSTGAFRLAPVAPGTYDLVVTSPGRATAVVTGVTVLSNTLTDVSNAALAPPASASGVARGKVTVQPTPATLDAVVRVQQALLPSGTTVEVAGASADATTGEYSFTLPTGAPVRAAFTASGAALAFAPAASSAGAYLVRAVAAGITKGPTAVTVTETTPAIADFLFP